MVVLRVMPPRINREFTRRHCRYGSCRRGMEPALQRTDCAEAAANRAADTPLSYFALTVPEADWVKWGLVWPQRPPGAAAPIGSEFDLEYSFSPAAADFAATTSPENASIGAKFPAQGVAHCSAHMFQALQAGGTKSP